MDAVVSTEAGEQQEVLRHIHPLFLEPSIWEAVVGHLEEIVVHGRSLVKSDHLSYSSIANHRKIKYQIEDSKKITHQTVYRRRSVISLSTGTIGR